MVEPIWQIVPHRTSGTFSGRVMAAWEVLIPAFTIRVVEWAEWYISEAPGSQSRLDQNRSQVESVKYDSGNKIGQISQILCK